MCRYMYNRSMTNNNTTKDNNMTKQEIINPSQNEHSKDVSSRFQG